MSLEQERQAAVRLLEQVKAIGHDDESTLLTVVEGETNLLEAIDAIMLSSQQDKAYSEAIGEMIDTLTYRKKRLQERCDAKREIVLSAMQDIDVKKLDRPCFTISVSAGKPKVMILDEALLPDKFVRMKREADKKAIADALARGESVDGALLSNAESFLTVRVK